MQRQPINLCHPFQVGLANVLVNQIDNLLDKVEGWEAERDSVLLYCEDNHLEVAEVCRNMTIIRRCCMQSSVGK